MTKRRTFLRLLTGMAAVGVLTSGPAAAQDYPEDTVTIIVSFSPGGATDVIARKVAEQLSVQYGESFIVENRPGAGGVLGTTMAARAEPDGQTLFLAQVSSHGVAPMLYEKDRLNYDPIADFTAIGLIAASPQIMVVDAESPIQSVDDFVAYAKENPGRTTYGSSGVGTTIHLAGEMFNDMADVEMVHVPYQGSGPAVTALLSGQLDVMFDDLPSAMPHVQSGTLRAIAMTTDEPAPAFPDLRSLGSLGQAHGLAGFDASAWFALMGPAGMPAEVTSSLNAALNEVLAEPEMAEFLASRGATPLGGTPPEASDFIADELQKWGEVIEAGGITAE